MPVAVDSDVVEGSTVTLTKLWLNLASDPSQFLALSLHTLEHTPQVNIRVGIYAAGNPRAFTTPGRPKQAKVTLNFLAADQVATLKAWQGSLVCFRDPTGEKFYGIYTDPDFTPQPGTVGTPVSLTVNELAHSEAV